MMRASIGGRLTAWYVGVLAVALAIFAGGSWWLSTQSVMRAADVNLSARIEGVHSFLQNPQSRLDVEDLREEFDEYAELTQGEALLEVVDDSGHVLCRPAIPDWQQLTRTAHDGRAADRLIGGMPFRVAAASVNAHGHAYAVTVAAPMGPAYAALNRFHQWLLLLLPITIVLAGAGGYAVSRRALAPVDDITNAVRAITVRSLDRRLDLPPTNDELRRLAVTFNDVLAQLESAVGDIVRFTADASHELRTPVSLVRTTAEVALRHPRTEGEYRSALADVARQAQHLSALIGDLLVLARIDAGIEPASTAPLDLRESVRDAIADSEPAAQARGVRLSAELPPAPVTLAGDRESIRRALAILVDNAIKYSHPCGPVRVHLDGGTRQGAGTHETIVTIADQGIGLDEAEAVRLFERFYRGVRVRQHAPDGTGLGLAIARTLVDRHRGTLALGPGPGGRGCEVRVSLPGSIQPSA
jgi:two-component system, OmpR family, heavy metal sensor histidine kinase CusS